MYKLLILLGFLFCSGCGTLKPLTEGYITPELLDMVDEIRSHYPKQSPYKVSHIVIVPDLLLECEKDSILNDRCRTRVSDVHLNDSYKRAAGVCTSNRFGPIEVLISERFWLSADKYDKQGLLAHELGHCDFRLDHSESGLMHPHSHVSRHEVKLKGIFEAFLDAL